MLRQEDIKEQDVSMIAISNAKDIFSWLAEAFLHIFVCFAVANMNTHCCSKNFFNPFKR